MNAAGSLSPPAACRIIAQVLHILFSFAYKIYNKYLNNEIYVKLFKKDEDGKEFTGILNEVSDEEKYIVLKLDNKDKKIFLKDIATAHTVYDFDAVLKQNSDNINLNKLNKFNKKQGELEK